MNHTKVTLISVLTLVAVGASTVQLAAQVTGTGTKGKIAVWTSSTSLGNSSITQVGNGIAVTSGSVSVSGTTTSAKGVGVFGHAKATTGNTSGGVVGQADSSGGASGVYGHSTAITGIGNGVFGQTDAPAGAGVFGFATSSTGSATGGTFVSSGPAAPAVYGEATAKTGVGGAVVGKNDSDDPGGGSALTGISATTTGTVQGLYAETNSPNAIVAIFRAHAGGNLLIGQVGTPGADVFRVDAAGKGFFDGGTQTGGADFAESVSVAGVKAHYEPTDLLAVDPSANRQLILASEPYSTLVAGIYSTKPGVLASTHTMDAIALRDEVPLAVVGIVPCKVSAENGAIQRGDLLVASSTPGHAMKGTERSKMLGAVVGKALEPLEAGKGVIQVLVTLQ